VRFVPNIISIFRICLVPVFIIVYFSGDEDSNIYAVLIYALAAFSDFLDGFIARRYKVSSNMGKFLDPLGDKLMTISVMVCITIDGLIPLWAVLLVALKELLMATGGLVLHKKAHVELPPSNIIGKASTVVFFLVCVALMIFRNMPNWASLSLISIAIGLTFIALAVYLINYIRIMKNINNTKTAAP
jgi:CDP-diacylglycerol--glycerol-3-phosphate 3-phosphatidyltransferase